MNPVYIEMLKKVDVKKTAMYVGGALLLIIMILYVRKKIREAKAERAEEVKRKEYQESLETAISTGGELSFPEADYKIMADQIFTYLIETGVGNGGLFGVNQKGIYGIMEKMNTDADVYKLIEAFGDRELRAPYKLWGKKMHNLPSALSEILFKGEVSEINAILASKGIKFRL